MSLPNEDDEEEDSRGAGCRQLVAPRLDSGLRPPRSGRNEHQTTEPMRADALDKKQKPLAISMQRGRYKTALIALALAAWCLNASSQLVGCQLAPQPATNQTEVQSESSPANNSTRLPEATSGHHQRASRIYRIRALGSNGSFAGATLRVNPLRIRAEAENQFGERKHQQSGARLLQAASGRPRPACVEAETVATAETSSVSASSPTLRLMNKLPPGSTRGDGELDESLLGAGRAAIGGEVQQLAESQAGAEQRPTQGSEQRAPASNFDSVLSLIDEFDSKIATNKTEAQLSCDSGEMVLKLNFSQPFRGVVYPDHNRLSPCRFFGDGHHNYELRLPLRGCGTRQVAPRVFVNDVIVRFHKTLELEEDEVKTLICRYPPPLDAAISGANGGQSAAGSGSLQSLDSSRFASGDAGHQQPFELIDPISGRPTTSRLGHHSETYSELLAPSSGRHRTQSANDLLLASPPVSPADRILNRHHNTHDHQLLSSSSSGVKQLNSRLAQLEGPTRLDELQANSNSTPSFVDRLTSIELLFLISSLMFLVLLAFGLAGGYYCFSRRDRRRNLPPGSVPKLLSRQRRQRSYLNSPTSLLGAGAAPTASMNLMAGPGKRYPIHEHQPRGRQLFATGRQHQSAAERQNFREVYGLADPNSYYQQYLQQQAQAAPSSPDDSDISGQNLLPAAKRFESSGSYRPMSSGAPLPSAHYQASTLRPSYLPSASQLRPAGILGRRQNQELVNYPTDVVAGRRATAFYSNNLQRPHKAGGSAALRSSAVNLARVQPPHYLQPNQTASSTLGRRVTNLTIGQPFKEQLVNVSTDPPHQSEGRAHQSILYGDRQHRADESNRKSANLHFAQTQHARSVQKLRDENQAPNLDHAQQQAKHLNDERIKQKQRQHFFDTSTLTRADSRQKQSAELRVLDVLPSVSSGDSDSLVTASDSEIELTSEKRRNDERPRLILKSIEDSFVTNLTEIYEQEYKRRDNTRPLSMSQWRSLQPQAQAQSGTQKKGSEIAEDDDDDDDDYNHDDANHGQSSQTNLRSLTELDVNFARSLLRPSTSSKKSDGEKVTAGNSGEGSSGAGKLDKTSAELQASTAMGGSSLDDLTISPDYNCGQLRLKRSDEPKGADGTRSPGDPHESISFA